MTDNRTTRRILLEPVAGSRFQPTGFPDLGPAQFQRYRKASDGRQEVVNSLHVESPQSMANRMELTTWDVSQQEQVPELAGLPYVRVVDGDGRFVTSSRLEAHRLASAYIMDSTVEDTSGRDWLASKLKAAKGESSGFNHRNVFEQVCRLDPLSLVHGVFFAQKKWSWQPKVARAVTAFIDADDVLQANSGGVKADSYDTAGGSGGSAGSAEGYGMVPHGRVEFTAAAITAYVTVDHEQLRSYGLGDDGVQLLEAIIDFELARCFRPDGMRLRTACDLRVVDVDGPPLPSTEQSESRLTSAISAADDLLGDVTTVTWTGRKKQ